MEYKIEKRICQNCKKEFTIEPEDFNFYKKINVPPPTWCPECRIIRRINFQNTWNLYWRKCDKCGNKNISIFSPDKKVLGYCPSCWWGDSWDGTEYGMDYDPTRPFLEQVKELINKTPFTLLEADHLTIKNSEYSNGIGWSKDCYLVFWADYCDNVYYSSMLNGLKHSSDCLRGFESELCYGSTGFSRCYNLFFSDECDDCLNVWFSRNCYGCTNCIGCVNLRGVSYYIFNEKYTKEEYEKKLKEFELNSWDSLQKLEKKAQKFWSSKPYREYNGHSLNFNVTGEHVYVSKNSKEAYIVNGTEDCKWCQFVTVPPVKDCMDYSGWGNNVDQIYESTAIGEGSSTIYFSNYCWSESLDLQYCAWNITGKNNFGCINLKRKQYCILNKQYTKESFDRLRTRIIADMKKNPYIDKLGRKYYYGEFFPPEFSKLPYNKSNAMKFFPKTKEEVLREGYSWEDEEKQKYKTTLKSENLPDLVKDIKDSILKEVIKCNICESAYKITQGELGLLQKMDLPLPHSCPKCRESGRFNRMTRPKMYHRRCMKCQKPIYTPYAPDDPRIVYCVECYQAEFL